MRASAYYPAEIEGVRHAQKQAAPVRLTGVEGVFVEDEQAASGIRVSARTMRDLICGG